MKNTTKTKFLIATLLIAIWGLSYVAYKQFESQDVPILYQGASVIAPTISASSTPVKSWPCPSAKCPS